MILCHVTCEQGIVADLEVVMLLQERLTSKAKKKLLPAITFDNVRHFFCVFINYVI